MCHVSDLIKYLLFTQRVCNITHSISSLFCNSLIDVISAVWMDASSGSAPLLVMSTNTGAKPTFLLCSLITHCRFSCHYYFFCVVCSAVFFLSFPVYFLRHSRIICCLPTMGVVTNSYLLSPSVLPKIFNPISLGLVLYTGLQLANF